MLAAHGFLCTGQAQKLEIGSSSQPTAFTVFDESGALTNASLDQFEGKIVLAYYYTPW
ncbi:MAG: hypothetical protein ACKVHP_04795 [Verrucomicrobiales bacterium]